MNHKLRIAAACLIAMFGVAAHAQDQVVTIYSADGLHDGTPSWYGEEFAAFTKATGIKVQYVEAGSGGVVQRIAQERANVQADVLVTLPPFMQQADKNGLLQSFRPGAISHIDAKQIGEKDRFVPVMYNYSDFIFNTSVLKQAPTSFNDLLNPQFKQKIQYSTPGQAGDGTAVMLQAFQAFGGKAGGLKYLKALQVNNLGPSSSTGRLTALVNKGELYVANGDVQMNLAQQQDNPNIGIFFPTWPNGKKVAMPLPYYIALVKGAPHEANAKKLIDFMLSKQAQMEASSIAYGLPVRDDVHPTDDKYKKFHALMQGTTIWSPNWTQVLDHLDADVKDYNTQVGNP